ncbi:cation diffusion facilitator family transporter [Pigmentiphaga litoralis]|uniref:Cation diffusion facilitator family transporter n=1 Tax=Pigmentiphaga litoralis TaxID=516702 RepID=A0A7Y9IWU7_9BURK|nr:cation diffusion facilitator family transporter [Pigmentiphaga litoralis]NYE22741.1 cation diffusion facilitator family transporter [Pigmentiphaga litoralis]NYE83644.1 cation diffusion facilitator family transporter [Pigmentiphaga litoralis]
MTPASRLAVGTIVVGVAVLGLKYLAYVLTGSVALYSDALESIINVATAVATLAAVSVSAMPADANHPYGHQKAEYLSAVLEAALILVAALLILKEAWQGFMAPTPLQAPALGLAINVGAGVLNGIWSFVLFRFGRRWRSPALVADAHHLWTDVVSSIGVVIGVALVAWTGWAKLDSVIAALVAVDILWSGWKLMRESVGGLMDEAVPPDVQATIASVIATHATGAIQANAVRTRRSGNLTFIEFNLVTPGEMTVADAHDICDRIEDALSHAVVDSSVTIHIEPEQHAVSHGAVTVA